MASTFSTTARRHLRRNFSLGLVNGALFNLSASLLDPSLVLTWLASQLTSSNFLIGLVMPMNQGGWFLPQLLISGYLQGRKRKRISDQRGNRGLILLASLVGLATPLAALLIPLLVRYYYVPAAATAKSLLKSLEARCAGPKRSFRR